MHYPNDKSSPRYPNLINEWSPLTVNKNIHLFKHLSDKREFKKKKDIETISCMFVLDVLFLGFYVSSFFVWVFFILTKI